MTEQELRNSLPVSSRQDVMAREIIVQNLVNLRAEVRSGKRDEFLSDEEKTRLRFAKYLYDQGLIA